eukprot:m.37407 g.37407  ORF g.37407 m.37407 type:complete len:54 (+) comp17657_c0_seq1:1333-1494(+)
MLTSTSVSDVDIGINIKIKININRTLNESIDLFLQLKQPKNNIFFDDIAKLNV